MSIYDEKGRITRAGAEQVIREGGSVAIGGKLYQSIDKLPNEAEFAKGDKDSGVGAKARLEKTIADAQAQLKTIKDDEKSGTITEVGSDGPNAQAGKAPAGKS